MEVCRGELVLEHPLRERLADHRPAVVDAEALADLGAVRVGRLLELVESRATPSGVTIQVYRPTGRPQYGTATADMKHVT
jgi:hypothetical protein